MALAGATSRSEIRIDFASESRSQLFRGLYGGIVGYCLLVAAVLWRFGGEPAIGFLLLAATIVVTLSFFRPAISLYILILIGFVCDQFHLFNGWTAPLKYHTNLNNINPALKGLSITPMELHLVLIVLGTVLNIMLNGRKARHLVALTPMLLYSVVVILGLVYGLAKGGDFLPGLWEVRGIFYLFFLAFLIPHIIVTERQIRIVVWMMVLGLVFRATEVLYLYGDNGWTLGTFDGFGNHEDAGFWATMLSFTIGLLIFKSYPVLRYTMFALVLPFFMATIASGRRTFYAVLANSIIVTFLMLDNALQRKMLRAAWKLGVVFVLYLAIFWNSDSEIASPARSIRMSFASDVEEAGGRYLSNMYRKVEDFNLATSYRSQTIIGAGYGTRLTFYMPLPLSWDIGFYSPHNQILGVFVKIGFVGFIVFMFFYLSVLAEISSTFDREKSPYLKAVLILAAAAIMNHLIFSFFDIMLTGYRNNLQVGTMIGVVASIIGIQRAASPTDETPPKPSTSTALQPWFTKREPEVEYSK